MHGRRRWLEMTAAFAGAAAASRIGAQPYPGVPHEYARVDPQHTMRFPRDFGAHPGFRTEWWYVTGWLDGNRGFQVTFFRARTAHPSSNPSRFAPTQLLFAQAALMLPENGHALHGQRAARIGAPGAAFSEEDANVAIGNWTFSRGADDRYHTVIRDSSFSFDLVLSPPGEPGQEINRPWLQGEQGFSRKGPRPEQASHYYSRPQLRVSGRVNDKPVQGTAWFDHEWSSTYLDPLASGWDWTGLNLDDGSALMAFRIRRRGDERNGDGSAGTSGERSTQKSTEKSSEKNAEKSTEKITEKIAEGTVTPEPLWSYCALRHRDGRIEPLDPVRFEVLRRWQSPRTTANYPVSVRLVMPGRTLTLEPLFDDQEIDARQSTGTIYWEGAVRVIDGNGLGAGRGYLELTGYSTALKI